MVLELMECGPRVTTVTWVNLSVAQPRGPCVLRTSCCYGVLLCLLPSHPSSSQNYVKNLRGLPVLDWAIFQTLTITMIDLFQTLLLEQINDPITTLGKNLEMQIFHNDHHPQKTFGKIKLLVRQKQTNKQTNTNKHKQKTYSDSQVQREAWLGMRFCKHKAQSWSHFNKQGHTL